MLDVIWRHQPIARLGVAELTGLTTGAVTRIAQVLTDQGLLSESIAHAGGRGSPSRPLSIRPEGGLAYGASFSHSFIDVGLVALDGTIIAHRRKPFSRATPEMLRDRIANCIESIEADKGKPENVFGLGIAVPGDFSAKQPSIRAHPYFPELDGVNLVEAFGEISGYSASIENDCNAAALGERFHGWGLRYPTFVNVFICHGIGGGLVLDGTLYRGVNGNAGGIHTFFPFAEPRPSGHDLFDVMAREGQPIRDFCDLEIDDVLEVPGMRPWIARAGAQLQTALTRVARLIDPDAIVIGGRIPTPILDVIRDVVDGPGFCADSPSAKPVVHASSIGGAAGVIGAAATSIFETLLARGKRSPRDNFVR